MYDHLVEMKNKRRRNSYKQNKNNEDEKGNNDNVNFSSLFHQAKKQKRKNVRIKNTNQNNNSEKKTNANQSSSRPTSNTNSNGSKSNSNRPNIFPVPFPANERRRNGDIIRLPRNGFLRDVEPYQDAYRLALKTSYQGFQCDPVNDNHSNDGIEQWKFDHEGIRGSLLSMEKAGFFRTDVTQPFGLGTKCAKTYVTRCLLGEPGTTYKYLGLRMFSIPWRKPQPVNDNHRGRRENKKVNSQMQPTLNQDEANDDTNEISFNPNIIDAMLQLNDTLEQRTAHHLQQLKKDRNNSFSGRAKFDVTLINRMEDRPDLKVEPTHGNERCTVSWHADSSLEHFSSIAVYHNFFPINSKDADKDSDRNNTEMSSGHRSSERWSIALRVAHNSEGPAASHRGTDINSAVIEETPSIAVTLPPGSAYYLLDDFNHHHQHAVLVNKSTENDSNSVNNGNNKLEAGVRFASTHRLLREGHNVYFIIERCRVTCSQFHKKGPKLWRSEQLLLTEIESEWIRQFYIQGLDHKKMRWNIFWKNPICTLLMYWSKLETRTKQIIELLQYASEERCNLTLPNKKIPTPKTPSENNKDLTTHYVPSRAERKKNEKKKKALNTVNDILSRKEGNNSIKGEKYSRVNGDDIIDPQQFLYEPLVKLLEERAMMRSLWKKREKDHVFKRMDECSRPIPLPFQFESFSQPEIKFDNYDSSEIGTSPLIGTPDSLQKLATDLKKYGQAFASCNYIDLPLPKLNQQPQQSSIVTQSEESTMQEELAVEELSKDCASQNETEKLKQFPITSPLISNLVSNRKLLDDSEMADPATSREESKLSSNMNPKINKSHDQNNLKTETWNCWGDDLKFGLEMQQPWAALLLDGTKTIETRAYNLPSELIGKKIQILESKPGIDGVSALPNIIGANEHSEMSDYVKCVGWCIFDHVIIYRYRSKFEKDAGKHLVSKNSGYGWKDESDLRYGWVVKESGKYSDPNEINKYSRMVRRMRSIYELQRNTKPMIPKRPSNKKKRKKKKGRNN